MKGKAQNNLIVSAHALTEEKVMKKRANFKRIRPIMDVGQMT